MRPAKSPGAVAAHGASKNDPLGGKVFSKTKRQKRFAQAPIWAELIGSHPRQQLELFTAPAPADALTGLAVRLPHDPCRCGADLSEIGPGNGPHSAALECLACGGHRGWLSHTTHKFLTEIVNKFGRPETPIVIQRGTSFAAPAAKTHDGSPPATCVSPSGGGTRTKAMSLGKRKSGNDFLPALKYDARVGQMLLQDRVFIDGRYESEQRVVNDKFRAVFDLENLQRGWIKFPKGAAPETTLVSAGVDPGDPPSDEHKEGLRIVVKMDDVLGGNVRELMSTAVTLWNAIDDLHDKYLADVADHPGQLPVVTLTGTRERKTQSGTSFVPRFAIADWVPRPAELPAAGIPTGQPRKASTAAKPAGPSRPVAVKDGFSDEIPF